MALPLGKLTIIVGAGLVGSVLAKEGRISNVSDFFTGAFKIAFKGLKQEGSSTSQPKPRNDSLMQQVNSLREELQLLASNRSVMIVTGERSASGKYGVVVITVVVGYGYIWWKPHIIPFIGLCAGSRVDNYVGKEGWKLSDMMFATRRGLNDACSSVAKQLETVYSSISVTKKHLSSRIDRVDCKIDEVSDNTNATKEEVSGLRGDVKKIGSEFKSVHHVVRSLETKISRIEVRQNQLNSGVEKLVGYAYNVGNNISIQEIEGDASSSSRQALEMPKVSPSRTASLPIKALGEPPSPSTTVSGSLKKAASFQPPGPASGLKELYGNTDGVEVPDLSSPPGLNEIRASEETDISSSSSSQFLGRIGQLSGFLTRTRSVVPSAK